jgi:UDP-N-acetyl-D-glucosamine dehydrogenase
MQLTVELLTARLGRGQLVVLESTAYPCTTEEVVLPILEKSGIQCPISPCVTDGREVKAGEEPETDFLLAYSPERDDSGNKQVKKASDFENQRKS